MEQLIAVRESNKTGNLQIRKTILDIESEVVKLPGAMMGDCFPLTHTFGDSLYVREIRMPKGMLVISKIHKCTHPYFVLSGECSVLTENGIVRIKAPYSGITKAGTKRILYIHEDTVWTTVHANPSNTKDLKIIEDEIIAKSFEELGDSCIDVESEKINLLDFVEQMKDENLKEGL